MERSDLDLRFSVFEGNAASVNRVILFGHLRAETNDPLGPRPRLLIMCRDDSGCPPPWITQSVVTEQDVARLVCLLRAAGFPRRVPRIVAPDGPLDATPHLVLIVRLSGRRRSLNLVLGHAGFSGDDAEPLRAVLSRLGELAAVGGRPAVRAVLDGLVLDRRCCDRPVQPRDGLPHRGLVVGSGCGVDGPARLVLPTGIPAGDCGEASQSWMFDTDPGG